MGMEVIRQLPLLIIVEGIKVALFVLGAGATRGCSFVDPNDDPCLPPLDSDFFTQLQRIQNPKHQTLITQVMKDVVEIFGYNFNVTMENVFTTLEHTLNMLEVSGESRDFKISDLRDKRDRLVQAISVVLEEALTQRGRAGRSTLEVKLCAYHENLVQKHLLPRDDILSFNYDCVIDYALKNNGNNKWNAKHGYGFPLGSRSSRLRGFEYWQPSIQCPPTETIHLYKLHGSLHFKAKEAHAKPVVTLKERPYTHQTGNLKFSIIPPEWHKSYNKGIFSDIWKNGANAIHRTEHLVIIGYSLPATDLHSTALFRTSIKKASLKSLVIVNPDKTARQRIRNVVQRGLDLHTRVISFDKFAEFSSCKQSIWRV